MKAYWDSSALVQSHLDNSIHARLAREGAITRTHSLSEVFSALTGKGAIAMTANDAAHAIKGLLQYLEFVDLTAAEIAEALAKAQARGVRDGRIHDYIHAVAAGKSSAQKLVTLDEHDFDGLVQKVTVEII